MLDDTMSKRIHIFGASGSGTTSLGRAISLKLDIPHLDTDRFYWKKTDPPFLEKNHPSDRVRMIENEILGHDSWILSGSICSWGDPLLNYFTLAFFLYLSPSIRIARLKNREKARHDQRIEPGGDMYNQNKEFMSWARSYDTASASIRSLKLHEQWMKRLTCPIIRLDSSQPIDALAQEAVASAVV